MIADIPLFGVTGLFLLLGFILVVGSITQYLRSNKMKDWPVTEATITNVDTKHKVRKGRDKWKVYVEFQYQVRSQRYTERKRVGKFRDEGKYQACIEEYPVGKVMTIFYDPNNPESIETKQINMSMNQLMGGVITGGVFALIALIALFKNLF